jgi:cold shock CspA family protein
MRVTGRISKWVPESGWGICNSYSNGSNAPQKFFVHISRLADPNSCIEQGSRISFEVGQPRGKNDLPAALNIQVFATLATTDDGGAK